MAAYVIVEIHVTDPVKFEEYKKLAQGSIGSFGGNSGIPDAGACPGMVGVGAIPESEGVETIIRGDEDDCG